MKDALIRTWSKDRLKNEICLISNRIDNLNHCSMSDAITQSILIRELNRREAKTLRHLTDSERHALTLRQIKVIHLGNNRMNQEVL